MGEYAIKKISEQVFELVKADGKKYKVDIGEPATCTCDDHFYRKKICKHILMCMGLKSGVNIK